MAKKDVVTAQSAVDNTALTENSKVEVKQKQKKDKKKNKNKPNKIAQSTRETASELKKVTWPSFKNVVKDTSIVIAFVIVFAVILFGIDTFLSWIVGLMA